MSKSIRYYFFTSILAVLIACTLVMGLLQMYLSISYFRQERENVLTQVVSGVRDGVRRGQIDPKDSTQRSVAFMAKITGLDVLMADPNGQVIFTTINMRHLLGTSMPQSIITGISKEAQYKEVGHLAGMYKTNYYTIAAEMLSEEGVQLGFIIASSNETTLRDYLNDIGAGFLLSVGAVLLLAVALAWVLTARTVKPLKSIGNVARRFGSGDFSARVPIVGDDELAQLAITFNEMANSFEVIDVSRRSFMGNIAHELRTPMTSIKGFIDGMLDGTIPKEQHGKYLGIVSEEVGRLARLTQNMLDISKLEAGEQEPKSEIFDIWEPLAVVFINAEKRLVAGDIKVEGLDSHIPAAIMADKDFVHQIIFNLLDNAIKFTPKNGTITASVKKGRSTTTISIRNTGVGIPKIVQPQIFDRFFKVDQSRGINAGGSGLGLHICKVLVNMMGGRIWVNSEEGLYTEFAFMLPNATQKPHW